MKTRKIIAVFSAIMITGALGVNVISAENSNDNKEESITKISEVIPEDGSYLSSPYYIGSNNNSISYRSALPTQVDLSCDNPYFPQIGDQGRLGSCAAFATTYYQYSYEVNKLNKITSSSDRIYYSPSWTYGLLSDGSGNGGIGVTNAYETLANFGCLKIEDLPYNTTSLVDFPENMESQKLEALETRLTSFGSYDISAEGTAITSNTDSDLNMVKSTLSLGKVLVVTSPFSWDAKSGFGNYSDKEIFYRAKWSGAGHAMAIVGYDDNVSCDVNCNGAIEPCEKGAFKIANSWGVNSGDQGYIWVLYDALNKISANTIGNWESKLQGTRHSAFEFSCEENTFFYINVGHKNVNYVGEVLVNAPDRSKIRLGINRTNKSVTQAPTYNSLFPFNATITSNGEYSNLRNSNPFNGVILFDYDNLCSPISNYLSGYNLHTKLLDSENACNNSKFRIIDNLGNIICNYESNNSSQAKSIYKYKNINITLGDADLNGVVDLYDQILISSYITGKDLLSNVQFAAADYNKDGTVDIYDAIAIANDYN